MAQVGFEPTTSGLLVRCSTNCATEPFNNSVGHFSVGYHHWCCPEDGSNKLNLLIPSYFGPTLYTKGGGGGGHLDPYYLINTWLYQPQILQGIRYTLQDLRKHKVCKKSFVWLPWQLFDNMVLFANNCQNDFKKQVFFKCSQKPQIRRW